MTTWLLFLLSKAFSNPVPCRATIPFHSLRERVEATLYGGCRSIWKLENAINFFLLLTFFKRKLPVLVLYFLLDVNQIGGANISFQILRQGFCGLFQVPLIVLQNEIFFTFEDFFGMLSYLPQRFHIGCFSADNKQRRRCTSKSADTRTKCPRPSSKTVLRSKTCCVAASHPSSPSPWCTTCSRTSVTASDSCTDCNKKGNASRLLWTSLGLRGHFWLHLRHI